MKYKTYTFFVICSAFFNTALINSGSKAPSISHATRLDIFQLDRLRADQACTDLFAIDMSQKPISYVAKLGQLFLVNRDSAGRLITVRQVTASGCLKPYVPTIEEQNHCRYGICLESKEIFHHGCAKCLEPSSVDMLFNVTKSRVQELGFANVSVCAICKAKL